MFEMLDKLLDFICNNEHFNVNEKVSLINTIKEEANTKINEITQGYYYCERCNNWYHTSEIVESSKQISELNSIKSGEAFNYPKKTISFKYCPKGHAGLSKTMRD